VGELGGADPEVMERLSEIHEPGTLADMVAAAALQDPEERQRILAEPDVGKRIEIASGALGALMLRVHEKNRRSEPPGWGVGSGLRRGGRAGAGTTKRRSDGTTERRNGRASVGPPPGRGRGRRTGR
jgi:hypothetical protein